MCVGDVRSSGQAELLKDNTSLKVAMAA